MRGWPCATGVCTARTTGIAGGPAGSEHARLAPSGLRLCRPALQPRLLRPHTFPTPAAQSHFKLHNKKGFSDVGVVHPAAVVPEEARRFVQLAAARAVREITLQVRPPPAAAARSPVPARCPPGWLCTLQFGRCALPRPALLPRFCASAAPTPPLLRHLPCSRARRGRARWC